MAHAHSIREYPGQLGAFIALSAAVGAGAALLFTPRTGKQHREQIKLQTTKLKSKLQRDQDPKAVAKRAVQQTARRGAAATETAKSTAKTAKTAARRSAAASTTRRRSTTGSRRNLTAAEIRRNGEP